MTDAEIIARASASRCADCTELLCGPLVYCMGCRRQCHAECVLYDTPDGVTPRCESCHFAHKTKVFLKFARGNHEGFKERPSRKLTKLPY